MVKNNLNVLDMVQAYADDNDINADDLFKKSSAPVPESEQAAAELIKDDELVMKPVTSSKGKKGRRNWKPDQSLTEDLPENAAPVTYAKDEIVTERDGTLVDIVDDTSLAASREVMDDMTRKNANIEDAKARYGIKHLKIPEGEWHAKIFAAAGDTNYKRSKEKLNEIFEIIVNQFPEFVMEWIDKPNDTTNQTGNRIVEVPDNVTFISTGSEEDISEVTYESSDDVLNDTTVQENEVDTKIIINKKQTPDLAWTKEELDRIKKSRSVELNIVEDVTLKYNNIQDIDDNTVDAVLSQYIRKVNDVPGALPASKYRATFTGLTYVEILDLSHSQELNNLDGERKKWSIAYDHIKNPSIGDFEDFDDFLKKTSFMDLEFILWKILCATSMDQEIISIDCHGTFNGSACGRTYDWIYSPKELLIMDKINPNTLEEMKKTSEVQSVEDIQANYMESMLQMNNTVELPSSGLGLVFGHISAYDYLNTIYQEIKSLQEMKNPMLSQALSYSTLTILKAFMIPQPDGTTSRIRGSKNLIRVINNLDEIDWQTISELVRIMLEPYQFEYSLRDICCPQCNTKSSIPIEDISRLLFIVAQSLSSVQVVLKRT